MSKSDGLLACLGQCIKHALMYIGFILCCFMFFVSDIMNEDDFMSLFLWVLVPIPFYWIYRLGFFLHTVWLYAQKKEPYSIAIGYQTLNRHQKVNAFMIGLFWGCVLYFFHMLVIYQDAKNNFPMPNL